jgi:hypothetical protein
MECYAIRKGVTPTEIYYKDKEGFHPVNIQVLTNTVAMSCFNFRTSAEFLPTGEDTVMVAVGYKTTRVGAAVKDIGLYAPMVEDEVVRAMGINIRNPYIFPLEEPTGGDVNA